MYCSKYVYCLLVKRVERDERVIGEGEEGVRGERDDKGREEKGERDE